MLLGLQLKEYPKLLALLLLHSVLELEEQSLQVLELREVLTQHLHCAQLQGPLVLLVVLKELVVWTQLEVVQLLARALPLVLALVEFLARVVQAEPLVQAARIRRLVQKEPQVQVELLVVLDDVGLEAS